MQNTFVVVVNTRRICRHVRQFTQLLHRCPPASQACSSFSAWVVLDASGAAPPAAAACSSAATSGRPPPASWRTAWCVPLSAPGRPTVALPRSPCAPCESSALCMNYGCCKTHLPVPTHSTCEKLSWTLYHSPKRKVFWKLALAPGLVVPCWVICSTQPQKP